MNFDGPITLASRNRGKLRELEALSAGALSLALLAAEAPEVVEDGATYLDNARKKAESAARFTAGWALADDSGLEVDALGGAPGVRSARYGGPSLNDRGRVTHLLTELGGATDRKARFRCCLFLCDANHSLWTEGTLEGRIATVPSGDGGFGYDPVFLADCFPGRTLAQVTAAEKNGVSHRALALRALLARL